MFNNDILMFIILFVLAVVFSDTFFAEFFIFVFALLQFSEKMSHSHDIITTYDYYLGAFLFFLNAIYALVCMIQWVSENNQKKKNGDAV